MVKRVNFIVRLRIDPVHFMGNSSCLINLLTFSRPSLKTYRNGVKKGLERGEEERFEHTEGGPCVGPETSHPKSKLKYGW